MQMIYLGMCAEWSSDSLIPLFAQNRSRQLRIFWVTANIFACYGLCGYIQ